MGLLLTLAWRNILRQRRRSIMTMVALVFATFFVITMRGLGAGTWEYNVRNALELFSGYLQIQRSGYQESPSLQKSFSYPGTIERALAEESTLTGFAPRITADGLISCRSNSSGAALFGIVPERELKIFKFGARLNAGRFLASDRSGEILMGHKLMRNLGAAIGDTVVLLAQGYDGVLGNLKFRIAGTMKFGIPEFDATSVFLLLPDLQELLSMQGRVNIIALAVNGLEEIEPARRAIAGRLSGNAQLSVLSWDEVLPDLKQAMEFDRIGDWLFFSVLIVVVAFGILNTVLMSVTERHREFGISLAIGVESSTLVRIVFLELLLLAAAGILIGAAGGQLVNHYFAAHPIQFTGEFADLYEEYGFLPQMVATDRITLPLTVSGFMLLMCCAAAVYPAWRVYTLEPLKGIRQT